MRKWITREIDRKNEYLNVEIDKIIKIVSDKNKLKGLFPQIFIGATGATLMSDEGKAK